MTDKLYRMAHTSNNRQQSLLICLLCEGCFRYTSIGAEEKKKNNFSVGI